MFFFICLYFGVRVGNLTLSFDIVVYGNKVGILVFFLFYGEKWEDIRVMYLLLFFQINLIGCILIGYFEDLRFLGFKGIV